MRSRLFAMLWCAVLVVGLGWGVAWAGLFDNLTDKVKGAVRTQTGETADKAKARTQERTEEAADTAGAKARGETGDAARTAERTVRGPEAGNIVFSKSPINPANPFGLEGSFQAGDPIYAAAFLGKSVRVLSGNPENKKVYSEISFWRVQPPRYSYQQPSEMFIEYSAVTLTGGILDKNVLLFEILPRVEGMTSYGNPEMTYKKFGKTADGPVKIAESLAKLEAGRQTIVFKVKINYKDVATGDFVLEGTDFSKLASLAETYRKGEVAQATAGAEMPKAAKSDRKLEAEMIAALKASRTFNDRMKGQILKLVIIDPDWYIRRHAISGVILHRYIRAAAAVKDAKGECRVWNLITYQQDYVGGRFQKTRFDGVGDPTPIACGNVK
jgi:hypothetical protein